MTIKAILVSPLDNVVSLLQTAGPGELVCYSDADGEVSVPAAEPIPRFFKMAIQQIPVGDPVLKYGFKIGAALKTIKPGELVHVEQMASSRCE